MDEVKAYTSDELALSKKDIVKKLAKHQPMRLISFAESGRKKNMTVPNKDTRIFILIFLRGLKMISGAIIKPLERWITKGEVPEDLTQL